MRFWIEQSSRIIRYCGLKNYLTFLIGRIKWPLAADGDIYMTNYYVDEFRFFADNGKGEEDKLKQTKRSHLYAKKVKNVVIC